MWCLDMRRSEHRDITTVNMKERAHSILNNLEQKQENCGVEKTES